jgi:putative transposase
VPEYPFHDRTIQVTQYRRICIGRRKINLSTIFGGQMSVSGGSLTASGLSALWNMTWDFIDEKHNTLEPVGENPFASKVLPMSSE